MTKKQARVDFNPQIGTGRFRSTPLLSLLFSLFSLSLLSLLFLYVFAQPYIHAARPMARKLALNLALFLVSMSALALLLVVVAANSNQADSMSLISANESVNPVADCCQNKSLSMRPPVPTPVNFSEMNFTLSRNDSFFDILNEAMIRRSWVWNETSCKPGLAASFCRVLQRLDQGQCLNIQVLGGSTTLGRRVPSRDLFWYVQLETWLNKKFPCGGLKHRVGVHAVSGATSETHLGWYLPLTLLLFLLVVVVGTPIF